jgi:FtsP/CotA-like multicopper oxidase with cupredoxin domain
MSSDGSPYVTPDPTDTDPSASVLETTIIAAKTAGVDVGAGLLANVETYNGVIPGPTLRLNVGDTAIVRLINLLDHPTGIHWHGIELSNSADGTEVTQEPAAARFPMPPPDPVPEGGTYLYKFKAFRPGIFWYHPHHHLSINRVFRGLYGMIIVADPNEAALIATGVIPGPADTKELVLSDITVCKAPGMNDPATYPDPTMVVPPSDAAEWLSGSAAQAAPTPVNLCEVGPGGATNDDGSVAVVSYGAGDIPSMIRGAGRLNEGQVVLTNGRNVGGRAGTPDNPAPALAPGAFAHDVLAGQGLRLQIANCATLRYFRLRLTRANGDIVRLVRIGGEGGLLDAAQVEGGTKDTLVMKYDLGEILVPPASRVDVVAAIPDDEPLGSKLTLWTRDFKRLGPVGSTDNFADLPSVPVMHLNITGPAPSTYTIDQDTPLRASIPDPVETLGGPDDTLLDPLTFVPAKIGMANQDIAITTPPGINGFPGTFEGFVPYTSAPHIDASRFAEDGRTLQLTVTNESQAHHPFHLHGFSFQPISLVPRPGAPPSVTGSYTWPYREFRDNIDIPANYRLTIRVRLDDRELVDGVTMGGAFGRWLFHCHIFFHHHQGMISELVVTNADGKEKPNVDVGGSWAYTPSGGVATRRGTWHSPEGNPVTLAATLGTVTQNLDGTWDWEYDTAAAGAPDAVHYVYVTATDTVTSLLDQTVFRLKIGAPDDGGDNGDPHIRTVDGKYYDFQAAGEFTLLRDHAGLEIQARQTPVPSATPITDSYSGLQSCVSVNTAVAARVGAHTVSYQPHPDSHVRLQLFLDGKAADISERGLDLDAGRIVAFPVGTATGIRIDYANGTVLTITPYFWSSYNIWILNVGVAHTDADMGIMGRIPPQTWLPLLPNGATVGPKPADPGERYIALYRTFANAWRVTDATSLFVYAPGTSTKTFTDPKWPGETPPCKPQPRFEIPGANPPLVNIKPAIAERLCKPVTVDDLHRGCVFDVATTGDKALVENYLRAQEVRLTSTAVQLVSDKPRTRPGDTVVFTATVSALIGGQPVPTGHVVFLVDDQDVSKRIDLDKRGRASFKIASLSLGVRRVRAVYTSNDETYRSSSSPSLRHAVERKPAADRRLAPYQLTGVFYEACDCFTICPCWLGSDPDGGECTGVFAWEIEKGSIDGVDVAGLRAVSISHHTGSREDAKQRVVIFVDERATRRQMDAMAAAFSGRLGGPLQQLADLLGELRAVEPAPIVFRREGRLTTLTIDRRIRVEGAASEGPSGRLMALNHGKLATVLGTPAEIGQSGRFHIGLSDHGMEIDVRGRSTMSGRFSYTHRPTPGARVPDAGRGH